MLVKWGGSVNGSPDGEGWSTYSVRRDWRNGARSTSTGEGSAGPNRSQVIFCLLREKLDEHFQNTQATERNTLIYSEIEWNTIYSWYTRARKLCFLSIPIGYWWCNSVLLSNNYFIMVFTRRQMVHESMHMETMKQAAYWSTSCLCQSLLLRRENKNNALQSVFLRIIILKAQSLNLHCKLAQLWNMLCFLKNWIETHILSHGKQFIAHFYLPLTLISHQVVWELSKLSFPFPYFLKLCQKYTFGIIFKIY